jgi:hypothetical protein
VDGATEVEISADGALGESRLRHGWMGDPPRYLLRFIDVEDAVGWTRKETGLARVPSVRVGYHGELQPPQLYIVLDLAGEAVRITAVRIDGTSVTVVLGG